MRPTLALRLGAALALAGLLLPAQLVALRFMPRVAGRIPVAFHRCLLRLLRVRTEVRGHPPRPGTPTLVLANHVSWLDIPVLAALTPLSYVAKSEVSGWPVIGALAKLQRCLFVERSRKASTREVNQEVARRLRGGDAIVLFPEGTTGDGIRLLPFRSSLVGAARSALEEHHVADIALQPVAIAYRRRRGLPLTRRDMPAIAWYGDMELAPHLSALVRGGPIDVTVVWGEPIAFDRSTDRKRATLAAETAVRSGLAMLRAD